MSGDLTTFEKNYNEWKEEHPTRSPKRWIGTTDRIKAARFIANQTEKITKAQIKAADDIVASQENLRREVEQVYRGVDRIAAGLEGLRARFDWGFSELVWQIEKQREILQEISETLKKPLDTKAKELRERAEKAYTNGWIDDALKDFLESEKKNKYDFTVHHTLGNIYFIHKEKPKKALEYYRKAVKYSEPEAPSYASYSLLHIAEVKYLQEEYKDAKKATARAVDLSPDLDIAHYEHARYLAKTGNYDESINHLERSIRNDLYFAIKANLEEDFNVMKERFRKLILKIRDQARQSTRENIAKIRQYISDGEKFDTPVSSYRNEATKAENSLEVGSLISSVNAYHETRKTPRKVLETTIDHLESLITEIEEEIDEIEDEYSRKKETRQKVFVGLSFSVLVALIILFISLGTHWVIWIIPGNIIASIVLNIISRSRLSYTPLGYLIRGTGKEITNTWYERTVREKKEVPQSKLLDLKKSRQRLIGILRKT